MEVMEEEPSSSSELWQHPDLPNLILWNVMPISITIEQNEHKIKLKLSRSKDDSVKLHREENNQLRRVHVIFNQPGKIIDVDFASKLQTDYYINYHNTLIIRPLARRLTRLAQCSKLHYKLVMEHPIITGTCKVFLERPFTTPSYNAKYQEGKPLQFLCDVARNGKRLGDEVLSILNYRPPPPSQKRTTTTTKDKNKNPKKRVKRG